MRALLLASSLCALSTYSAAQSTLDPDDVLNLTQRVADWQIENPTGKPFNGWEYGTFYSGLADLYRATNDAKYYDELIRMGNATNWELYPRPYDANVYATGHSFLELYALTGEAHMVDKLRYTMDMPLHRRLEPEVTFEDNKYWWEWWTWCDALFMAPPTFLRGALLLDKPEYLDYMVQMWTRTSDYLYSEADSLYFRDDRFFDQRGPSGEKIFWSRGNGWVIEGLSKVLAYLPDDHPSRSFFENQFVEMIVRIRSLQLSNGSWPTGLLDPSGDLVLETSGTAFFCYGMAHGINMGLLSRDDFMPAIERAWQALESAVNDNGRLGFVQRVGDEPGDVAREDTGEYGVGAMLLAGSELYRLLQN